MNIDSENTPQSRKILDAALRCIASKGYANVSLRDIADEAGVVLSQLNYYYKNKEGLFIEVVKAVSEECIREIEESLKKGTSAEENLNYLIKYFENVLETNNELFKLLFDMTSMSLWYDSLGKYLNNLFKESSELIEKYIFDFSPVNGALKAHSSSDLSKIVLGAMYGTAIQAVLDSNNDTTVNSLSAIQMIFSQSF